MPGLPFAPLAFGVLILSSSLAMAQSARTSPGGPVQYYEGVTPRGIVTQRPDPSCGLVQVGSRRLWACPVQTTGSVSGSGAEIFPPGYFRGGESNRSGSGGNSGGNSGGRGGGGMGGGSRGGM